MSIDREELFRALAHLQPAGAEPAPISVPALVRSWLERGPAVFEGDDRARLDALCRQIDVRKKVSAGYGEGWTRLESETPAEPAVVSGLIAVLLANAAHVGDGGPRPDGSRNDGWGLKCTNSALKALDLDRDAPRAADLRVWAMEVLDRVDGRGAGNP